MSIVRFLSIFFLIATSTVSLSADVCNSLTKETQELNAPGMFKDNTTKLLNNDNRTTIIQHLKDNQKYSVKDSLIGTATSARSITDQDSVALIERAYNTGYGFQDYYGKDGNVPVAEENGITTLKRIKLLELNNCPGVTLRTQTIRINQGYKTTWCDHYYYTINIDGKEYGRWSHCLFPAQLALVTTKSTPTPAVGNRPSPAPTAKVEIPASTTATQICPIGQFSKKDLKPVKCEPCGGPEFNKNLKKAFREVMTSTTTSSKKSFEELLNLQAKTSLLKAAKALLTFRKDALEKLDKKDPSKVIKDAMDQLFASDAYTAKKDSLKVLRDFITKAFTAPENPTDMNAFLKALQETNTASISQADVVVLSNLFNSQISTTNNKLYDYLIDQLKAASVGTKYLETSTNELKNINDALAIKSADYPAFQKTFGAELKSKLADYTTCLDNQKDFSWITNDEDMCVTCAQDLLKNLYCTQSPNEHFMTAFINFTNTTYTKTATTPESPISEKDFARNLLTTTATVTTASSVSTASETSTGTVCNNGLDICNDPDPTSTASTTFSGSNPTTSPLIEFQPIPEGVISPWSSGSW